MLLQRFVPFEGEAGLFYIRYPGEAAGRITSITTKHAPVVIGNGRSTLRALILADRRAAAARHQYFPPLADRLEEAPARWGAGAARLSSATIAKGRSSATGASLATPALTARVDAMAQAMPGFHFGRFDVRYQSVAALRAGAFTVIEVNGVGSEATHIWDARTRLLDAWRDQFRHYRAAFEIGHANRARGVRPSGLRAMWRHWQLQRRLMRAYPAHD